MERFQRWEMRNVPLALDEFSRSGYCAARVKKEGSSEIPRRRVIDELSKPGL